MCGIGRYKVKLPPAVYLMVLVCSPLLAQAQVFKCKQTDGSLHFQSYPCPAGAAASTLAMPPAAREPIEAARLEGGPGRAALQAAPRSRKSPQEMAQDSDRRRAEQDLKRRNEEVTAYNRMQRCDHARRQLEIAKRARPIYRLDNAGDRHYVEDGNRATEITAAEQKVAAECQ